MSQTRLGKPSLDRLVHEKARLMILTYLASSDEPETAFTELRDALDMTPGNLSIQLKTLSEAGYVTISKTFKDNKPYTAALLTVEGTKALDRYFVEMETLLKAAKAPRKE